MTGFSLINKKMKWLLMIPAIIAMILLQACSAAPQKKPSQEQNEQACSDADTACLPDEKEKTGSNEPGSQYEEISFDEAISMFRDGKSGILYFGFADCPWCQELVPILTEELQSASKTAYFVRTRDEEKNRLYTDEQKEEIQPYLQPYMKENDEGVLTLYVPLVVVVRDGQVVTAHQGTVDGHDAHERKMTDEEAASLQKELRELVAA